MARKYKTFVDLPEREKLVHKRVWDASLSSVANEHLGRLNTLAEQGIKYYHHWDFQKYYTAELRILGCDVSIQMFPADSFYFEFFTTGNPVVTGMVGSPPVSSAKAACVGVNVALQMGGMTVNPKINTGKRDFDGRNISLVGRPFQVQLINEPVKFVPSTPPTIAMGRQRYPQALYEAYAPMHSHTGLYTNSLTVGWTFDPTLDWLSQYAGLTILPYQILPQGITLSPVSKGLVQPTCVEAIPPLNSWNLRDIGFDIPFMLGDSSSQVQIAYLNGPTNGASGTYDWPRKNGLIAINDEQWGTRTFALCIDAFSQFSVFPISEGEIGPITGSGIQNVQNSLVKSQGPMLPGWCYQMSETFMAYYTANSGGPDPTGNQAFPEISWSVHPSGLRACAVVYQQIAGVVDNAFITSSYLGTYNTSFAQEQCGIEGRDGYPTGPTGDRYQYGTGLVEVTLTIVLTGPEPGDYAFTADVATLRQPTTSHYCSLLAGYSYIDIQDTCSAGDLIAVDVERWYRPGPSRPSAVTLVAPFATNLSAGSGDSATYTASPAGVALDAPSVPVSTSYTPYVYYWDDVRRTVYSVKNYGAAWGGDASFAEINSFPGFPSGVISESVDTYPTLSNAVFDTVTDPPSAELYFGVGDRTEMPYGKIVVPQMYSDFSSVFLDFDIPTVSFALKLTTFQSASKAYPSVDLEGQANSFHHSVAIYVKNKLVKQLFPTTMSMANQDVATAALNTKFRETYVTGSDWTMIPLDDATTWGTSTIDGVSTTDLLNLRKVICGTNTISTVNPIGGGPFPISQACADWWGALGVYRLPLFLVTATTPSFAWNMYSDLIQNAIHKSPWSTFFVHPNGTWAFFDQSIVYNPYGHVTDAPFPTYDQTVPFLNPQIVGGAIHTFPITPPTFQALWAAFTALNPLEHCIFDWVHLQFTMGDGSIKSVDTSFLKLYNDAVMALDPNNVLDTFNPLTYAMMRTTFTPYFNGFYWAHMVSGRFTPAVGQWGFRCALLGANNFNVGETDPQSITGYSSIGGMRWSFMSLARVDTGAYTQPFTFSSCTLVDS